LEDITGLRADASTAVPDGPHPVITTPVTY
jgi:hypothetical protein